ncbi:MAG: transcription termination factor NusA, partial [Planctomycetes bacterium]|nr:transcription termination factor NusA [Planctomycetota bacterium]
MNGDLVRFVDSISRDKNIDKESIYLDLEVAMISAVRKAFDDAEDVKVAIDRTSGESEASVDGQAVSMAKLGRIAAQTGKQVMMQKIREDERNAIFEEYSQLVGTVVTGSLARFEGGSVIVNLGRGEGILPRSEQIPGDSMQPGERIRAMILDVREEPTQVRIILSQTHPDYIRRLFEIEVPEVGERIIIIQALAREAGYRTKIAVSSIDSKVDAVGACVGVRGSRIRNIVDELGGEKIDIVRWNESSQVLISNALKPAEVRETFLSFESGRAMVIVDESQLSLAIGKRGQNVRLAARLTGWDIDILTPAEYDKSVDEMEKTLRDIEGVQDVLLDKLLAMGIISIGDLVEVGPEPIAQGLEIDADLAARIVRAAVDQQAAKKIAAANPPAAPADGDSDGDISVPDDPASDDEDSATEQVDATSESTAVVEPSASDSPEPSEPVASVVVTDP